MKLGFIYLPLAALLYNSSGLCSDINLDDELKRVIQLSLEENDLGYEEENAGEDELKRAIQLSLEENDIEYEKENAGEDELRRAIQLSLEKNDLEYEKENAREDELRRAIQLSLEKNDLEYEKENAGEDELRRAIQLSLEENALEYGRHLNPQINTNDNVLKKANYSQLPSDFTLNSVEEAEENILLEEHYFSKRLEKEDNLKHNLNTQKEESLKIKPKVTDNDLLILTKIFQDLDKEYNHKLKELEELFFEGNLMLHYLNSLFVYNEDERDLAERTWLSIQEFQNLKQSTDERLKKIKLIAQEQGILEPKDQKAKMIAEFIAIKGCSESFAARAYKEFIGNWTSVKW